MSIYKGAASEGSRADMLLKMREREREDMNAKKAKVTSPSSVFLGGNVVHFSIENSNECVFFCT